MANLTLKQERFFSMGFTYSLLFLHVSKGSSFSNVELNRMIGKEDLKLQEL